MADYPMDTTVTDHLLATTRAVRKRLDLERPVEREVLLECLRLAVQSPTGSNAQNWHWIVVTDAEKRARLKELYDGMARPYLESQAEAAADPQTRRVYQSAVYLARHPRPGAGARDPVRRGPAREPGALRRPRASTARSCPRSGASCSRRDPEGLGTAWTTLHLANEAETAELLGIPDGMTQVGADPGRLLHRRRLQARRCDHRSRASPTGTPGALPARWSRSPRRDALHSNPRTRVERVMLSVVSRLETAAEGTRDHHLRRLRRRRRRPRRPGRVGAAPRRRPGHGRRAPGARRGTRRARRAARPDLARARHRDPGRLARRRHRRRAPAADAPRLDRGVRRRRPGRASPTPTPRSWSSTPSSRRSSTRCPTHAAVVAARRARRGGRARRRRRVGSPARRPRPPRDPAVHERLDRGPEGRDAPRPLRRREHRRDRRRRAITHADRAVSWLPLYHDMGLIGLLMTPMLHGLRARARRAAGLPRRARRAGWSGSRSTAAPSPRDRTSPTRSRRARCGAPATLDLSCWRLALNGAEPVDPGAVEAFCAAAAPHGFDAERRVLRVRHGRGHARGHVPRARARA